MLSRITHYVFLRDDEGKMGTLGPLEGYEYGRNIIGSRAENQQICRR